MTPNHPPSSPLASEADALLQAGLAASQADDSQRALELFAQAGAANPGSALPHFLIGSEYASLGEFDKAEAALANAVLLAPDFHLARYQLGLLQYSSGRAAVALVSWQPLLALDDSAALPHFVRGFAALAQDDFVAARQHFEAGLPRNTDNAALSSDIRMVLAKIERIQNPTPAGPAASAKEAESVPVDSAANHILISNYGRFGPLH